MSSGTTSTSAFYRACGWWGGCGCREDKFEDKNSERSSTLRYFELERKTAAGEGGIRESAAQKQYGLLDVVDEDAEDVTGYNFFRGRTSSARTGSRFSAAETTQERMSEQAGQATRMSGLDLTDELEDILLAKQRASQAKTQLLVEAQEKLQLEEEQHRLRLEELERKFEEERKLVESILAREQAEKARAEAEKAKLFAEQEQLQKERDDALKNAEKEKAESAALKNQDVTALKSQELRIQQLETLLEKQKSAADAAAQRAQEEATALQRERERASTARKLALEEKENELRAESERGAVRARVLEAALEAEKVAAEDAMRRQRLSEQRRFSVARLGFLEEKEKVLEEEKDAHAAKMLELEQLLEDQKKQTAEAVQREKTEKIRFAETLLQAEKDKAQLLREKELALQAEAEKTSKRLQELIALENEKSKKSNEDLVQQQESELKFFRDQEQKMRAENAAHKLRMDQLEQALEQQQQILEHAVAQDRERQAQFDADQHRASLAKRAILEETEQAFKLQIEEREKKILELEAALTEQLHLAAEGLEREVEESEEHEQQRDFVSRTKTELEHEREAELQKEAERQQLRLRELEKALERQRQAGEERLRQEQDAQERRASQERQQLLAEQEEVLAEEKRKFQEKLAELEARLQKEKRKTDAIAAREVERAQKLIAGQLAADKARADLLRARAEALQRQRTRQAESMKDLLSADGDGGDENINDESNENDRTSARNKMDEDKDAQQRLSRRPRGGGASKSKKDGAASPSSPFFVAQRVAGGEGSQKEQANRGSSSVSNTRTTLSERRATEVLGRSSQAQIASQPGGPRASASADPSRWVQEQEQAVTLGAWQSAAEKIYDAAEEEHELTKLIVAKQEAETQTDYNAPPALQTNKKAPGGAGGTAGAPAVAVPPLALSGSTSATPTQVNPAFTTALQKNKIISPRAGGANANKVGATSTSSPRSGAANNSPRTANRTTEEQQKLRELDFHLDHEKDVGSVLGAAKLSPKGWETSLRGAGGGAAFSPRGAGGGAFSPRTMSTTSPRTMSATSPRSAGAAAPSTTTMQAKVCSSALLDEV
ncbi:unnamed protein product [Amoebophrya sp. A120]|nr:unnamed protein product [Amoebophrya sp. A120]|eukprot:GSA120T00020960001.1